MGDPCTKFLLTPAVTGNMRHCTILTSAVTQKMLLTNVLTYRQRVLNGLLDVLIHRKLGLELQILYCVHFHCFTLSFEL